METPFAVGRIVRPPYFIDRTAEISRLATTLGSLSENQLVVAIRRMGKSSLLANVVDEIRRSYPTTLVAQLDCRRVTNTESFVDELVRAALTAYQDEHPVAGWLRLKARLMTDKITELVPEVQRVGAQGGGEALGILFTAYLEFRERRIDPDRFITQAFEFLERFTNARTQGLVVVLDEFQELDKLQTPLVFQLFKSYGDRLPKIRFCFSGSSVSLLEKIFLRADSPLYLTAGKVPLEPLPQDVVTGFVDQRIRHAEMTIDPVAAKRVYELTGGIPFYVQKVGLTAWLNAIAHHETHITVEAVEAAFDDMLWEFTSEFEARFEYKYGAQQKAILLELAARGASARADLAKATQRTTGTLSQGLTALETAMEIRKLERGTYEMCDPVFARWLRTAVKESPAAYPPRRTRSAPAARPARR